MEIKDLTQQTTSSLRNRLTQKLISCSFSKDDLIRLCQILEERNNAASELEVKYCDSLNKNNQDISDKIRLLRDSFGIQVTINGMDGEELYGSIADVFNSPNFPEKVKSLYVNSESTLKALYNWYPRNSFELYLDFTKPDLFDFSVVPSDRTPNASNLIVSGYDATWANGVFNEIIKYIEKKPTSLHVLHYHSIYDLLLWLMGLPLGFWTAYKSSKFIESLFGQFSTFVQNAAYLYILSAIKPQLRLSSQLDGNQPNSGISQSKYGFPFQ